MNGTSSATSARNEGAGNTAKWVHQPVMLRECLEVLSPAIGATSEKGSESWQNATQKPALFDCTLGLGGHTIAFLKQFPNLEVVGIDRDINALEIASARASEAGVQNRLHPFLGKYNQIREAIESTGSQPSAFLFDLGVSSMQLDDADRGFSYTKDAPLDMRMGQSEDNDTPTAAELIQTMDEDELAGILKDYSDERFSKQIAAALKREMPSTTSELATVVRLNTPKALSNDEKMSSIKRVFQALRIAVNNELHILEEALTIALDTLPEHGRIAVLSYHSLEDKMVKNMFAKAAGNAPKTAVELCIPIPSADSGAEFKLVFNGSRKASEEEIMNNSRAASVRFRAIERVKPKSVGEK